MTKIQKKNEKKNEWNQSTLKTQKKIYDNNNKRVSILWIMVPTGGFLLCNKYYIIMAYNYMQPEYLIEFIFIHIIRILSIWLLLTRFYARSI